MLRNRVQALEGRALATPPERAIGVSEEQLVAELVDDFQIEPLVLDLDGITADHEETQINLGIGSSGRPVYRPALAVTYFVPFTGEADLFKCRASSWTSVVPSGLVRDAHVELRYVSSDSTPESVKSQLDADTREVQRWVGFQAPQLEAYNASLPGLAEAAIRRRTATVRSNLDLVAALGVPMRKRDEPLTTYPAPEVRRKPPTRAASPPASKATQLEPTILSDDYESILSILRDMIRVIELSPAAFVRMKEEELRTLFLVHLNGHYQGSATGETFNFEGKTDILVKSEGRNVFIAECKFWAGPKALLDTIDQLLGYTSWRDTKTAILVFNRGRALSTVLEKVSPTVAEHANFVRELAYGDETSFRFEMRHRDDPERHFTLTIEVFELPRPGRPARPAVTT